MINFRINFPKDKIVTVNFGGGGGGCSCGGNCTGSCRSEGCASGCNGCSGCTGTCATICQGTCGRTCAWELNNSENIHRISQSAFYPASQNVGTNCNIYKE
jgi:hypothetical protein